MRFAFRDKSAKNCLCSTHNVNWNESEVDMATVPRSVSNEVNLPCADRSR